METGTTTGMSTYHSFTPTAITSHMAKGVNDNDPCTEEPCAAKVARTVLEAVLLIHYVTHVPPRYVSLTLFTPYVGGTYLSGKLYGKGVTCITS